MTDVRAQFRALFSSPGGEAVLVEICKMGHLFEEAANEQERIEENFAKRILNLAKADEDGFVSSFSFWDIFKRLKQRSK